MVRAVETRSDPAPQYIGLRLSADEYLALPDDGFRYQVINGVVVMSPSPTPRHQAILLEISGQVHGYLKANPIARVFPDIDVRFAADLVYRPDLVVVKTERLPRPLTRIDVIPDLIVEIVSPGSESMDARTKRADYERFGVEEYWIVSATDPLAVQVLRLTGGKYVEQKGPAVSIVLPGFALNLKGVQAAAQV